MQAIIGKDFPSKVIPLIDAAMRSIKVVVFDWRWPTDDPGNPVSLFNQSIVRAIRRGVAVSAVINYEAALRVLRSVGVDARKVQSANLMHAKMIIFDDCDVVVGSHNFSQHAFTQNFEVSVFLPDCSEIQSFEKFFDALYY